MRELGYELEELPLDEVPPADRQPWLAIVDGDGATHAVACVGLTVLHDGNEPRSTIKPADVLSAWRIVRDRLVRRRSARDGRPQSINLVTHAPSRAQAEGTGGPYDRAVSSRT
jgi:hypothetical protein